MAKKQKNIFNFVVGKAVETPWLLQTVKQTIVEWANFENNEAVVVLSGLKVKDLENLAKHARLRKKECRNNKAGGYFIHVSPDLSIRMEIGND